MIKLVISETTNDYIKIAGAISDNGWSVKQADEPAQPIELPLDKAASQLEAALVYAIKGGIQKGKAVMFKHPITIKSASEKKPAIVLDDRGLSEALKLASEGKLTKEAQNAFCDELVAAIDDAKIDAKDAGMELSMPLKLEFRDEATKNAFMNIGRKRKLKKTAAAIAELGRTNLLNKMVEKLAKCGMKAKKSKKSKKYGKGQKSAQEIMAVLTKAGKMVQKKRLEKSAVDPQTTALLSTMGLGAGTNLLAEGGNKQSILDLLRGGAIGAGAFGGATVADDRLGKLLMPLLGKLGVTSEGTADAVGMGLGGLGGAAGAEYLTRGMKGEKKDDGKKKEETAEKPEKNDE